MRTKLICGIALVAIGLALLKFLPPSKEVPQSKAEQATAPFESGRAVDPRTNELRPPPAQLVVESNRLNERTLVGTKWEREGFAIEFSSDGKLLIGGRERAKWHIQGSRIRLYRETTGEEHWLEIVGDKLTWKGQEIGRVQ